MPSAEMIVKALKWTDYGKILHIELNRVKSYILCPAGFGDTDVSIMFSSFAYCDEL